MFIQGDFQTKSNWFSYFS